MQTCCLGQSVLEQSAYQDQSLQIWWRGIGGERHGLYVGSGWLRIWVVKEGSWGEERLFDRLM